MRKLLGKYTLGTHTVKVYTDDEDDGGSFNRREDLPILIVGTRQKEWWEVLDVLFHEAFEFTFSQMNVRYVPDIDYGDAADGYLFVFNHAKFSEVAARVANFCAQCVPDLAKRYNKMRKKCSKRK